MEKLLALEGIYRDLAVIGSENLLLLLGCIVTIFLVRLVFHWLNSMPLFANQRERLQRLHRFIRNGLLLLLGIFCTTALAYNGYLIYQQVDVLEQTLEWARKIPPDFWEQLAIGVSKIIALGVVAALVLRWLRRLLEALKQRAKAYEQIQANDESIEAFFVSLGRTLGNCIWLGVFILSAG